MIHKKKLCVILILIMFLSSCIGVKADIVMRQNGSGSIELEYRLSRLAETLGKLDGNEHLPIIPIGKIDFERTVARIEGLRLQSFSTRNDGKDTINTVKLEFTNPEVLVRFLSAVRQSAVLTQDQRKYSLSMSLTSGNSNIDPDLLALFTTVSEGYSVNISLTAPRTATLALFDSRKTPLTNVSGITLVPNGRKVSFLSPLGTLFTYSNGLGVEILWE